MGQRTIMRKKSSPRASAPEESGSLEGKRSFAVAAESPCDSCPRTPCCSYLPIGKIRLETYAEVDHARFLLNFDRIELGLFRTGRWEVFYRAPCRFLDAAAARCRIHDQPEQPRICRYYNPYRCWYKPAFGGSETADYLRVDRQRLDALLPRLVFDGENRLVDVPGWAELTRLWSPFPLTAWSDGGIPGDGLANQSGLGVPSAGGTAEVLPATLRYADLVDLCAGCSAWCCRALMLSQVTPATATSLDFLRFVIGFPGVSLGLSDDGWQIVVRTACRRLVGGRCELYGRPDRPRECRYLDAWNCKPRRRLGLPRHESFLEIPLDLFPSFVETFRFDPAGRITHFPSLQELQAHLDACGRPGTDP